MAKSFIKIILYAIVLLSLASCDNSSVKPQQVDSIITSTLKDSIELINSTKDTITSIQLDTLPKIKFSMLQLNDSVREQLPKQFPDSQLIIICALNRIDPNRLHRADSLMIPDSIYADFIKYSPYPLHIQKADSIDKLILVSYPLQAFALYTAGKLERWGPVSMGGKATQTPTGMFHTNWKSKSQISTDNASWILPWYFNLVNHTGVSFHQFELPGFPASHSCIRLRQIDAEYIYYYAEQWKLDEKGWNIHVEGTPVIIYNKYPFGEARPWFKRAIDSESTKESVSKLGIIIEPYYEQILREQLIRKNYEQTTKFELVDSLM